MAKRRRTYTREFKAEADCRIVAEGKGRAEVARALRLGESLLRIWRTAQAADGGQASPDRGRLPAAEALPASAGRTRDHARQEPPGGQPGRRADGVILRRPEGGIGPRRKSRRERVGAGEPLRLHRGLL
jgi:transposase-like protein